MTVVIVAFDLIWLGQTAWIRMIRRAIQIQVVDTRTNIFLQRTGGMYSTLCESI